MGQLALVFPCPENQEREVQSDVLISSVIQDVVWDLKTNEVILPAVSALDEHWDAYCRD